MKGAMRPNRNDERPLLPSPAETGCCSPTAQRASGADVQDWPEPRSAGDAGSSGVISLTM